MFVSKVKMPVFYLLEVCVITLVALSNNLVDTNTNMELFLFEKSTSNNAKLIPNMYVTSSTSLPDCCTACSNMAECGSVNYNSLYVDDNCELVSSGINDTLLNLETGWNIYSENKGNSVR